MRGHVAALLAIFTVAAGVGWNIASHPESSVGLGAIALDQRSERSDPGQSASLARIRIRVSPSEGHSVRVRVSPSGLETATTDHQVPRITLAAE
jgi:hypothetical protein